MQALLQNICNYSFTVAFLELYILFSHSNGKIHQSKSDAHGSHSTLIVQKGNQFSTKNCETLLFRKPLKSVLAVIRWALKIVLSQFSKILPFLVVIRWALKIVWSQFSKMYYLDLNNLLKNMLADNETAKLFKMSKTSYFSEILLKNINYSPLFSLLFVESLNKVK